MHSILYRVLHVVELTVISLIVMALLTAMSTIARNWIVQPRAIVSNLSVSISTVAPMVAHGLASLDPATNQYMVQGELDKNIRLTLPDSEMDSQTKRIMNFMLPRSDSGLYAGLASDQSTDKVNWGHVSPEVAMQKLSARGVAYVHRLRFFDRVHIAVSGTVDLASCWDWNTKSIYVAFIARYRTNRASQNEVIFLDAMIRHVTSSDDMYALQSIPPSQRTKEQKQQWLNFEQSLRHPVHDHPSVYIDHINKKLHLNNSYKYYLEDVYPDTLAGATVDVIMRYQVLSYSGWTPLREDAVIVPLSITVPRA